MNQESTHNGYTPNPKRSLYLPSGKERGQDKKTENGGGHGINSPSKHPAVRDEFLSPEKLKLKVGSPFRQNSSRISFSASPNPLTTTRSMAKEAGLKKQELTSKQDKIKRRKRLSEGFIKEGDSTEINGGLSFKKQKQRPDSAKSPEGIFVHKQGERCRSKSEPGSREGDAQYNGNMGGFGDGGKTWSGDLGRNSGMGVGGHKNQGGGSKLINCGSQQGENKVNAVKSTGGNQVSSPKTAGDNSPFSEGRSHDHIREPGRGRGGGGRAWVKSMNGIGNGGRCEEFMNRGGGGLRGQKQIKGSHRGSWNNRGRGGGLKKVRGRTAAMKRGSVIGSLVQGESKEYIEYPGWSADKIHWLLEEVECFRRQNRNVDWRWISSIVKTHSQTECENLWMQIIGSLKPLVLETAFDYVKMLLSQSVNKEKAKKIDVLPKQQMFIDIFAEQENLTKIPLQILHNKLRTMNNLKKAKYFARYWQSVKECGRGYVYYFKEHPEEFEELSDLRYWYGMKRLSQLSLV